jgi:microcystin-dependent protein
MRSLAIALVAALLALAPASAGSGSGTVYGTTSNGGSPPTYTLSVNATTDLTVGDHLVAFTGTASSGSSGVWLVTAKTATTITIQDSLTEGNGAVAFGAPASTAPRNRFAFATPGANGLTPIPDTAVNYAYAGGAMRRNVAQTGTGGGTTHAVLSATHSDTTAGTVVRGDLITGQGATPRWVRLALGASGRYLRSDGTDAAWTAIASGDLPTIPVTGGGTNATTASGARTNLGLAIGTDIQAYHALLAAIAGTTPTKGRIFVCDGTTIQALTVGTNGQVLTADSAQSTGLTWSAAGGGGGTHQLLSATHPDTTSAAVQRGDLITGQGASTTWSRLAKGSSGTYLRSDGTDVGYSGLDLGDATAGTLAIGRGGTGGATASAARTALGLAINTDVQAYDGDLAALAALAHTAGYTIVSVGGAWVAAAPEFFDDIFAIKDNADATKRAVFQASGINTATTRTYTLPNASGTLALTSDITATGDFLDTVFRVYDQADSTKRVALETSGITTGNTRTLTVPDASGTIALTGHTHAAGTDLTGLVPVANGGTGAGTAAAGFDALAPTTTRGDLIARGASSNARLAVGASGRYLRSDGTDPSWAQLAAGDLTGQVAVANGGTGAATATANQVFAGPTSGGAAAPSFRALVATDVPDLSAVYQPLDAQLTDVAGVTPSANQFLGGTGSNLAMRTAAQVKTSLAIDHGADVTGLGDDDHTQYALLAGRSGGQTLIGGTGSGDGLNLRSTSHGTKGVVTVGDGTGAAFAAVDGAAGRTWVHGQTSAGNAVHELVRHEARTPSAGAASAGFGAAVDTYLFDAAGTTNRAGRYTIMWTDPTDGSEDADAVTSLVVAGTLTERARVTSEGAFVVAEVSAPSTPASGKVALYAKSDGLLYSKDDAGAESPVSGGVTSVAAGTGIQVSGTSTVTVSIAPAALMPVGATIAYVATSAPTGWLLCDGQAVSRSTYSALFAVIGTAYGAGDGSTTFNVPHMMGRVAMGVHPSGTGEVPTALGARTGEATHTLTTAEMPAHTHDVADDLVASPGAGAGIYVIESGGGTGGVHATTSTGSGGAHNTIPPVMGFNYIIYAGQ